MRQRLHRQRSRLLAAIAALAAVAAIAAVAGIALGSGAEERASSAAFATGGPAATEAVLATQHAATPDHLDGSYLLALEDGSVVEVSSSGDVLREVLLSWDRRASDDAIPLALGAREVAYDPQTDRLWYADSHLSVRSIELATGAPGPEITGFADTAVPGCGVANAARHIAVDIAGRRLIVPSLTGSVLLYDLDTAVLVDVVDPSRFGNDFVIYGFRHYAVDPLSGYAWYATSTGELVEVNPDLRTASGRRISLASQEAPAADANREMFIDPDGRMLVYQTTEGRLASIDLETLRPAAFTASFAAIAQAGSIEYVAN